MSNAQSISRRSHRSASQVAIPYLAISLLWIISSDRVLEWITQNPSVLTRLQTFKGMGFVLLSGVLVYCLSYLKVRRALTLERIEQQHQEEFRRAFEDAVTGMALLDLDGRILRANPVLATMLDRQVQALQRIHERDILHPDDRARRSEMHQALIKGRPLHEPVELRYLRSGGQIVWVLASSTLSRDANGQPLYFICQLLDITARREAEQKLRQQEQQLAHASRLITLGEMAAGLAHDLSQPISTILQYAQTSLNLIERGQADKLDAIAAALSDLTAQAQHTRHIVQRLRSLARKHTPAPRAVVVNTELEQILRLIASEADRRHVRISLDLQARDAAIHADPVQFQQLVINLINNALEAVMELPVGQRQVLVTSSRVDTDPPQLRISISDNGPGIPEDIKARIFDSFVTSKPAGVGLGLSICRAIVEGHGGRIWHERTEGRTVFHVQLPLMETPACSTVQA